MRASNVIHRSDKGGAIRSNCAVRNAIKGKVADPKSSDWASGTDGGLSMRDVRAQQGVVHSCCCVRRRGWRMVWRTNTQSRPCVGMDARGQGFMDVHEHVVQPLGVRDLEMNGFSCVHAHLRERSAEMDAYTRENTV